MLDSYQDLIDELIGTPTILRQGLDERSGAVPAEAARLIAALRDRDLAVLERLQTMLRQRDPVLRPCQRHGSGAKIPIRRPPWPGSTPPGVR